MLHLNTRLGRAVAGVVALGSVCAAGDVGAQAIRQLPADAFGRLPEVQSVTLSPDGQRVAMLAGNLQSERSIIVVPLDGREPTRIPTNDERPVNVRWMSNDRIAVTVLKYRRSSGRGSGSDRPRLLVMNPDGTKQIEIKPAAPVVNYLWDDPDYVLMQAGTAEYVTDGIRGRTGAEVVSRVDIYRVNIKNGRGKLVHSGLQDTSSWILGKDGTPRIRRDTATKTIVAGESGVGTSINVQATKTEYYTNPPGGSGWSLVRRQEADNDITTGEDQWSIVGLTSDEKKAYVVGNIDGANFTGLYTFDLTSGDLSKPIFTPEWVDLDGVGYDRFTREPVGYFWTEDKGRVHYWDPLLRDLYAQLVASFPKSEISITSWDRARTRFIVNLQGGTVASNYYLFDNETGKFSLIARAYPEIPDEFVNEVEWIWYNARDGLKIGGFVTYPKGRERKNLPAIVLPHGGPEARNQPGFGGELLWGQFLAHRGYVVLQPEPRHSGGFGRKFAELGYGRWGREMQDDLTDGLKHLVKQGLVDPDRVCIMGWSYGGYAAAAGATITPELYQCSIVGAAVTDLPEFLLTRKRQTGSRSATVEYWETILSKGGLDLDDIAAVSPARLAGRVRAPVMIVHGEIDTNVPIEQGELLADALKKAGKEYEFVRLENEGHNLLYGETYATYLEEVDRFLMKHNPAY